VHRKHMNARRLTVLLVCVCIAAAFLASDWFMLSHAGHDCTGEHCPICAHMHAVENLLRQLYMAGIAAPVVLLCLPASFASACRDGARGGLVTPVALKVRMDY